MDRKKYPVILEKNTEKIILGYINSNNNTYKKNIQLIKNKLNNKLISTYINKWLLKKGYLIDSEIKLKLENLFITYFIGSTEDINEFFNLLLDNNPLFINPNFKCNMISSVNSVYKKWFYKEFFTEIFNLKFSASEGVGGEIGKSEIFLSLFFKNIFNSSKKGDLSFNKIDGDEIEIKGTNATVAGQDVKYRFQRLLDILNKLNIDIHMSKSTFGKTHAKELFSKIKNLNNIQLEMVISGFLTFGHLESNLNELVSTLKEIIINEDFENFENFIGTVQLMEYIKQNKFSYLILFSKNGNFWFSEKLDNINFIKLFELFSIYIKNTWHWGHPERCRTNKIKLK